MSTTTTTRGGGLKLLLALVVAGIVAALATGVIDIGPSHTDNGDRSARQEVEFRASWAPETRVTIAYLVNFSGDQERHRVGPWSHSELAYRNSVYTLQVTAREDAWISYITCEIWVDGERVARDRVENRTVCEVRADMR